MGVPPGSQVAPLPSDLPFRIVSKTIGCGAYASIKKAIPRDKPKPVIAVKFINKEHAFRTGRLRPKQIELEISLHHNVSGHVNIIRYLTHGMDQSWIWIAMELAEGGDLFDKIEADEGVGEDIAHFYFKQLINAVAWCHGKGVAHRDIKPENMLLTANGDLKLADFGLATAYLNPNTGDSKMCGLVCGSPPYIAPEIFQVGHANRKRKHGEGKFGYSPNVSDIWSCAIVLFVLLVGNTPWDSPETEKSDEFYHFCEAQGRPKDDLWSKIPSEVLSLLRGMLRVDATNRFGLGDIRIHSWYTRSNPYMNSQGTVSDSINLATNMIERLHIDLSAPLSQNTQSQKPESQPTSAFTSTQPYTPVADQPFDWEAPPRLAARAGLSASQPVTSRDESRNLLARDVIAADFSEEPHMTQFSQTHTVPLTLTQRARQFRDIVPSQPLTRFYSYQALPQLLGTLRSALHTLSIPVPNPTPGEDRARQAYIRVHMSDGRKQGLNGSVVVERISDDGLVDVRFIKAKGDPLEWRRLFKRVVILCRDAIVMPSN